MEFRKAKGKDLPFIMEIIKESQAYFKKEGIDQWQNNYPNIDTVKRDIDKENAYVLLKDTTILAAVVVTFGREESYENIYQGSWKSSKEYAVIHRMAVSSQYKGLGLASIMIKHIEKICDDKKIFSIRVDTHRHNTSMKKLLEKNQFEFCGIIYLEDGAERIAFEKWGRKL